MPSGFGASGHADYNYSLYCNYTPSNGAVVPIKEPKSAVADSMQDEQLDILHTEQMVEPPVTAPDLFLITKNEVKLLLS